MKPKYVSKKLTLNKKTITNLNGSEMKDVYGGCYPTHVNSGCPIHTQTCFTCGPSICQSECPYVCWDPFDK